MAKGWNEKALEMLYSPFFFLYPYIFRNISLFSTPEATGNTLRMYLFDSWRFEGLSTTYGGRKAKAGSLGKCISALEKEACLCLLLCGSAKVIRRAEAVI